MAVSALSVQSVPQIGPNFARFIANRQATEYRSYFLNEEEQHPSTILQYHSEQGHRVGELYDVMVRTDATIAGLWEKRWKAVVGLPWEIVPADASPEGAQVAAACARVVDSLRNFDTNLQHQLSSVTHGVAFDELRWERLTRGPLSGMWVPVEVVDRPMWRFGFKNDGQLHVRTRDGALQPVPPGRFLVARHGTKDSPWGSPLLDRVWWFYWLGLHAWKYYGVALEKWAQPTVMVGYDRSDEAGVDEQVIGDALAAAAAIQTEQALAMPNGVTVKLLEAMRGGSVSYESFLALLDRAKALVFLGEIDTSGLSKGPGSYAKNRVSNDVRLETIRMDARELADTLTDQLLTPFVRVNFGPDAPVPYWEFDIVDADDRNLRQEAMQRVLNRGLEAPLADYYRLHQVRQPRPGERTVSDPQVVGTVTIAREKPAEEKTEPPAPEGAVDADTDWADQELTN